MKKMLKIGVWISVIFLVLFSGFTIAASADEVYPDADTEPISLEELLIGTWRWTDTNSYIIVFRPDGTGISGFPGLRFELVWHVDNGRLFIDGLDQNIRIDDDTITIDRFFSGTTYTYFRYSYETDASTSGWLLAVIGFVLLGFLAGVVVLITNSKLSNVARVSSRYF